MVLVFSWVVLSPLRTRVRGTNEMGGGEGMGAQRSPRVGTGQRAGAPWTSSPALQKFPRPPCKQIPMSGDLLRLGSGGHGNT